MKTLVFSLLIALSTFYFSSCVNSCPEILCNSAFSGGRVTLKEFNLKNNDSVLYVKFPKGNLQTPLDSFIVLIDLRKGGSANSVSVSLHQDFGINNDWKVIMPTKEEFTLTDINVFDGVCAECTRGYIYYDEYEVKVNGETQTGSVVITK